MRISKSTDDATTLVKPRTLQEDELHTILSDCLLKYFFASFMATKGTNVTITPNPLLI